MFESDTALAVPAALPQYVSQYVLLYQHNGPAGGERGEGRKDKGRRDKGRGEGRREKGERQNHINMMLMLQ